jgi:hypothetical protein
MSTPNDQAFKVHPRGYVRDNVILAHFRNSLRTIPNPATGQPFTEAEIQRATGPGTRFYIEADAIDLLGQAHQQRAQHLAAQVDPRRANTQMLEKIHGELWLGPEPRLRATGAAGTALATGTSGTVIPGSPTLGDPSAAIATTPNGLRLQCIADTTIAGGQAVVALRALEGGASSRVPADTELRWSSNANPGTDPTLRVLATFDGGFDVENDQQLSDRVANRIRRRPASGNADHFMTWAQEANAGVEQAFVYGTALSAGTVIVAATERRAPPGSTPVPEGPQARVPSLATLTDLTSYLTPPASPVVPERVMVIVTPIQPQPVNLVLAIDLPQGALGGWEATPWPRRTAVVDSFPITAVSPDGLTLQLVADSPLPSHAATLVGASAPGLMAWNAEISRWAQLDVASVTDSAPGLTTPRDFTIQLNSQPTLYDADGRERATPAVHVGDAISPATDRAEAIATTVENYFDTLGPGQLMPSYDRRYLRAQRQPDQSFPSKLSTSGLLEYVGAVLGLGVDVQIASVSRTEPDLAANAVDGPCMLVLGNVTVVPRG